MFPNTGKPNSVLIQEMREILIKPGFIAGRDADELKKLHNLGTSHGLGSLVFSMAPKLV